MMKPATILRYAAAPVPRYTSYPTAPHFSPAVGEEAYRRWLGAVPPGTDLSLYVHVPFCRAMCWYCACHTTVTARTAPVELYVAALRREIDLVAEALPAPMAVRHLHFGGGSPTLLSPEALARVLQGLEARFRLLDDAERAIEIDPRTLAGPMIAALARARFNRASIGVQSFDPAVQRAINRVQSFATTARAVFGLRAAGIAGINLDLIYGLPCQTTASCLDTIDRALSLQPDRIAIFGYAHVPTFKRHQRRIDAAVLPDGSARIEQANAMAEALSEAGYVQIGLDHFAKPGDPLAEVATRGTLHRNFQGYTTDPCPVLIGFGASAIGRLDEGYVQNLVRIGDYEQRVAEGRLPVLRGFALSGDDRVRAAVIERLMCDHAVDLGAVCARFGADPAALLHLPRLDLLATDGLIERRGTSIAVTADGRALVRSVAAAFDAYLAPDGAGHSRAA